MIHPPVTWRRAKAAECRAECTCVGKGTLGVSPPRSTFDGPGLQCMPGLVAPRFVDTPSLPDRERAAETKSSREQLPLLPDASESGCQFSTNCLKSLSGTRRGPQPLTHSRCVLPGRNHFVERTRFSMFYRDERLALFIDGSYHLLRRGQGALALPIYTTTSFSCRSSLRRGSSFCARLYYHRPPASTTTTTRRIRPAVATRPCTTTASRDGHRSRR